MAGWQLNLPVCEGGVGGQGYTQDFLFFIPRLSTVSVQSAFVKKNKKSWVYIVDCILSPDGKTMETETV